MIRILDFFLDLWDRLMAFIGLDRFTQRGRDMAFEGRSPLGRIIGWGRPLLTVLILAWIGYAVWQFAILRGWDLQYPQKTMTVAARGVDAGAEITPDGGQGGSTRTCAPARTVEVQQALIDQLVNQNAWVAADPIYKLGLFGILDWERTPFFDNKMSFQLGVLETVRLMSLELQDSLGRVRGTSEVDGDLQGAQSRLRVNERAWVFNNPFDPQLATVTTSAEHSYRGAIGLYQRYNDRLAACDALFDARADNLFDLLNRMTSNLGAMSERLASRARGEVWDRNAHEFVPTDGPGNDLGMFDTRADNLFHEASGRMYALHGILQAVRLDFQDVVENRRLADVWDRMEEHAAEAAALSPLIVSNGKPDGTFAPDHLSVMAAHLLRVRANMVELRSILDR